MASPIGNLIHPPDSSRTNPLPHSYGPAQSHPPHPSHQHPLPHHSHPQIHPSPLGVAVNNSTSNISLAPLITAPSAAGPGKPNGNGQIPASASAPSSAAPTTPQSASAAFPRGHSNTQSLYQCADCLREFHYGSCNRNTNKQPGRYSRPEHLQVCHKLHSISCTESPLLTRYSTETHCNPHPGETVYM